MQNLSSNNGTPQSPSYYLSASNSAALNDIFEQISSQIETGGASVKLDSSTVVKDIVSDYFTAGGYASRRYHLENGGF